MLEFSQVSIGTEGGCGCTRCVAPVPPEFTPAEVVAESIPAETDVMFTGPDALLHPHLPILIAGARAAGSARIGISTDAAGFAFGENAAGALHAGVRHVEVTLLGDAERHDRLTGREGGFAATRAGLAAFRDAADAAGASVMVRVRIPVCRHDVTHVVGAVTAAAALGADIVLLDATRTDADLAHYARWITAALETGTVNGVWVVAEGVPLCLLPGFELHAASVLGPRPELAKSAACRSCALGPWCPGVSAAAPGATLDALASPVEAGSLAGRIAFARGRDDRG